MRPCHSSAQKHPVAAHLTRSRSQSSRHSPQGFTGAGPDSSRPALLLPLPSSSSLPLEHARPAPTTRPWSGQSPPWLSLYCCPSGSQLPHLSQEKMVYLNWVTCEKFNKGTICRGMDRVYGNTTGTLWYPGLETVGSRSLGLRG